MYQKSTGVPSSITNNYSEQTGFIFIVKAYYELLSF